RRAACGGRGHEDGECAQGRPRRRGQDDQGAPGRQPRGRCRDLGIRVTLHFSYGSNMSRTLMSARCPGAVPLGVATLPGWRFVINPDSVGSLAPHAGGLVYGVLWRVNLRDLVAINAYESVDTELYLRRTLPVRLGARQAPALVFLARRRGEGTVR